MYNLRIGDCLSIDLPLNLYQHIRDAIAVVLSNSVGNNTHLLVELIQQFFNDIVVLLDEAPC
jgi:hypothetical protein